MQSSPIVAVSPITIPIPWSINNLLPIVAPGWISIPVKNLPICETNLAKNNNLFKGKDTSLDGSDVREGLTAVISVKIPEELLQFEGQTKGKLGTPEARSAVEGVTYESLKFFLEENKDTALSILEKAQKSKMAREAARKARESVRKGTTKSNKERVLSEKLAKATGKNFMKNELFLVEGDSAGGSAKSHRNRETQAILPLRGKVLNCEKASSKDIEGNAELRQLEYAIGAGLGADFDYKESNYGKIIIMTDADVDGAHIATLLLTFIYRFMPELIKKGYVYLAQPPLYRVEKNKKFWYAYSDEELNNILQEIGRDNNNKIQRYKGLGEMDAEQLWDTTMDPEKRILLRVNLDEDSASEIDLTFTTLMGDQVEPRREFIEANAKYVQNLDI